MLIYKSKFGYYQTIFKNKTFDNKEIKYYMPLAFKKGYEPNDESADIIMIDWWGSCFQSQDGNIKPKIFVSDWKYADGSKKPKTKKVEDDLIDDVFDNNDLDLSSDNLPFY